MCLKLLTTFILAALFIGELFYTSKKSRLILKCNFRGIRASHILLSKTKAVLTGFRNSISLIQNGERIKILHVLPSNASKSINWMAPELLEQNLLGYSERSDIYSVGITSCELANGIGPFADLPTTLMLTEKIRGNQPSLLDCSTFPSEEIIFEAMDSGIGIGEAYADQTRQIYSKRQLTDNFHKFAEECMGRYPENRPSASQLLAQNSFFKQCRHTCLEEQFITIIESGDFEKLNLLSILQKNKSDSDDNDLINVIASLNMHVDTEWDFE